MARTDSRGMILVKGMTYRIERTAPHTYSVVRLLDDLEVGSFRTSPVLRMHPHHIDVNVFRDVVRAALKSARTSAVMHAAPVFQPEEPRAAESSASGLAHRGSAQPSSRAPGSQPPKRTPSSAPPAPVMA